MNDLRHLFGSVSSVLVAVAVLSCCEKSGVECIVIPDDLPDAGLGFRASSEPESGGECDPDVSNINIST